MEELETITFEVGDEEHWICLCGNTPMGAGFYPCDLNGKIVEPTEKDWTTDLYVCNECGRIINYKTMQIVGQNLKAASRYSRCTAVERRRAQRDFEKWIDASRSPQS